MKSDKASSSEVIHWQMAYRMRFLLVFTFCLALLGCGMVLVNTYVIASLKEVLRREAIALAEEQGRKVAKELLQYVDYDGAGTVSQLHPSPELVQRLELELLGHDDIMAVCLIDDRGQVVYSQVGNSPDLLELKENEEGMEIKLDPSDFASVRIRLRKHLPKLRTMEIEVPLRNGTEVLGQLHILVSQSAIYRNIEFTARQINLRLWSLLLAFVGVLALGFYMVARLFRHQIHLLEENQKLDRMAYMGTLASGLAHEIRNPLNAMNLSLTVAREELDDGGGNSLQLASEALEHVQDEVGRLDRSLTSFMEFSHPAANSNHRTELNPLIEEVLDLLGPKIRELKTEVDLQIPKDAQLLADFSGLRQVIYNVILNALQAIEDKNSGEVAVSEVAVSDACIVIGGCRESAQWRLWIQDSGAGIEVGQEEKIFDVFQTTKAAGSGFGLAIARAIIDAHGGTIIACRLPEGGTRIEITLPETVL